MTTDQEQPNRSILPLVVIALWFAPVLLDLFGAENAEDMGAIAWEFAHGLPKWRRKFRKGWHRQAETDREAA